MLLQFGIKEHMEDENEDSLGTVEQHKEIVEDHMLEEAEYPGQAKQGQQNHHVHQITL